jgi:4-hydroxythreonine-4-phosphate dehydrogenase
MLLRCGITMGDPSGIGPEVIRKALSKRRVLSLADFVVIGDRKALAARRNLTIIDLNNVSAKGFHYGKIKPEYGRASIEYLDKAIGLLRSKKIDCLVTAPVNKKAINLSGYDFSGQTEYIAEAFGVKDALMLLCNKKLRVSLVTRHIPLKDVAGALNTAKIYNTIINTVLGLKGLFSISHPKVAVCALNPHASDNGIIGNEEKQAIIPAIARARGEGLSAEGPFPSDTIFEKAIRGSYDCVICMYHDQGLIPLKLTGFAYSINVTLGLPFVRTSPGHGTAFDIAGKNKADPTSLVEAIITALQCARNLKRD